MSFCEEPATTRCPEEKGALVAIKEEDDTGEEQKHPDTQPPNY